jgi:hypothetical protein
MVRIEKNNETCNLLGPVIWMLDGAIRRVAIFSSFLKKSVGQIELDWISILIGQIELDWISIFESLTFFLSIARPISAIS